MQSTYQTWLAVCKHHKIPKDEWHLNGQYNYIEFRNGSRIDLLDLKYLPAEDPLYERFGSLEYSDGAIDEAGETHPLAREMLRSRLNRKLNKELGITPILFSTGNPKKNWTYQTYYKPWKEGRLADTIVFIQALYKDNPYIVEEYGKTLAQIKDKTMRARLLDGNWEYEDDPGNLIQFEAITDLFTNSLEEDDKKYLTADIARYGEDKTVVFIWNGWEVEKILYREKQGIHQTIEWIKILLRDNHIPYSRAIIDEDGIGGGVVDMLQGVRGFIANASPEKEEGSLNSIDEKRVYANLKTQCGYCLAEKINNREVAIKTEDTKIRAWITEDLEQIKEAHVDSDDKKRRLVPKDEIKITLGRSPDFGDNMLMRAYFEIKKPQEDTDFTQFRPKWISQR